MQQLSSADIYPPSWNVLFLLQLAPVSLNGNDDDDDNNNNNNNVYTTINNIV